jgi:hypothetical protein
MGFRVWSAGFRVWGFERIGYFGNASGVACVALVLGADVRAREPIKSNHSKVERDRQHVAAL